MNRNYILGRQSTPKQVSTMVSKRKATDYNVELNKRVKNQSELSKANHQADWNASDDLENSPSNLLIASVPSVDVIIEDEDFLDIRDLFNESSDELYDHFAKSRSEESHQLRINRSSDDMFADVFDQKEIPPRSTDIIDKSTCVAPILFEDSFVGLTGALRAVDVPCVLSNNERKYMIDSIHQKVSTNFISNQACTVNEITGLTQFDEEFSKDYHGHSQFLKPNTLKNAKAESELGHSDIVTNVRSEVFEDYVDDFNVVTQEFDADDLKIEVKEPTEKNELISQEEFTDALIQSQSKISKMGEINNEELAEDKCELLSENTIATKEDPVAGPCVANENGTTSKPEIGQDSSKNISDIIKLKMLENVNKSIVSIANKSTGWTQFQEEFSESLAAQSQFHELGPFFGLPLKVKALIEKYRGIKSLYDWQEECLKLRAVKEKKNLVYALPTSGGKTLVAEILLLRELLCFKKNVLFILPFVAIVQEKVQSLSQLALELDFLVEEYAAGKGTIPPRKRRRKRTVIIATIEKALAVVQSLIEADRLSEIGLVVVDELHLISEGSGRGSALESVLTYLMFSSAKCHIVGMSATIGNLEELAKFLNAEIYTGNFRPVELSEYVKCGDTIYIVDKKSESGMTFKRSITSPTPGSDPDGLCVLVKEVCPLDSVLVFCSTKRNCENVASLLCKHLPKGMQNHRIEEKKALLKTLTLELGGRLCPILRECLKFGVAYHHSGLTGDERRLIEDAYRDGSLCCICCTSTLAAGVNLPAKRVILRAPYIGRDFINQSKYKQMVGRAGRAGLGQTGESFLICQRSDTAKVEELLNSKMDDVVSSLNDASCKDLVLAAVGLGVAKSRNDLRQFLYHTLLHTQSERLKVDVKSITDMCISSLYKQGALRIGDEEVVQTIADKLIDVSKLDVSVGRPIDMKPKKTLRITNSAKLSISRLGRAAMKGCMSLPTALRLYGDLVKAEGSLVLLCSLHLLYLVTPYQIPEQISPNYPLFFDVYMQLGSKEQHAAKVIGLTENSVSRMVMGQKPKNVPEETVNRFYVTLMLNELWKHQSVWDVSSLFQVPRGVVQNLMSSASNFTWNVLRFCDELEELWGVKAILAEFSPRLAHCCEAELLPLMDLPSVKRARARQLFTAGFKTVQQIARTHPRELVTAIDNLSVRTAVTIVAAAKLQLMEKVENLKEEAEDVLEDLALSNFSN